VPVLNGMRHVDILEERFGKDVVAQTRQIAPGVISCEPIVGYDLLRH